MRDAKITILEDQLDALAGRVTDAEQRFEKLLKILTTGEPRRRLGIDAEELRLRCEVYYSAGGKWKHSDQRRRQLAQAELDEFRRRVARAEARTEWSGESFLEAFGSVQKSEGDNVDDGCSTVRLTPGSNIWDKALVHLEAKVNRYCFTTWLQDTVLLSDEGGTLVIGVRDELTAAWLTSKYGDPVAAALGSLGRANATVTFVSTADDAKPD